MFKHIILISGFVVFLASSALAADNIKNIEFSANDRILVVAPHPDDESIGTGGILQEAVRRNLPVKIVYLTNGDFNELAFMVFKKRPVLSKRELIGMGETRRSEAVNAMGLLGLKENNLVFLGYPDTGTLKILMQFWGKTKPFKNHLTRSSAVPYRNCLSYNAPYVGESILNDFKNVLLNFQPTKIFVTGPADTNVDHRSAFLFVRIALWELGNQVPEAELYPFIIHAAGWPTPRGFHPDKRLTPPRPLQKSPMQWFTYSLTEDQIAKKKAMITMYKTEIPYNPWYLVTFARQNELFGLFPDIDLRDGAEPTGGQAPPPDAEASQEKPTPRKPLEVSQVKYEIKGQVLVMTVVANQWVENISGLSFYLLPFKRHVAFARMPKIHMRVSWDKTLTIYERRRPVFIKDAIIRAKGKEIVLQLPLSSLNNPDYILACVRSNIVPLPIEMSSWRTLRLN